jgi:hypothetical protein
MRRIAVAAILIGLGFGLPPQPASAQTFESVGTRAAGMGGAFVAVADDASAVYWNPAGLALGGAFFSMVIDNNLGKADPEETPYAGKQSGTLIAMTTLPLGLSYYRQSATRLSSPAALLGAPAVRVERLTTHHAGVTLVQSVTPSFALAATLKAVRGLAASGVVLDGNRDDLLDHSSVLPDRGTTKFSSDVGAMARFGGMRVGVTVRNITEPDFATPDGGSLELQRQSRVGVAYVGVPGVIVAGDVDLERVRGALGEVRNVAGGAELRLTTRVLARGGVRVNTLSDQPGGRAPVVSVGGTVATIRSVLVDGQVTLGSASGDRGWGIAARLLF